MFDWAFSDGWSLVRQIEITTDLPIDEKVFEKMTFCRVYGAMLEYFEVYYTQLVGLCLSADYHESGSRNIIHVVLASFVQDHPIIKTQKRRTAGSLGIDYQDHCPVLHA